MLFQNDSLRVREIEEKDKHILAKWLSDPQVLEFYEGRDKPFDLDKIKKEFYNSENDAVKCIVEFKGTRIGYIQFYQLDGETKKIYGYHNEEENIYGIDQFIGEVDYWNKGIGTLLVSSMVTYLVKDKKAVRVVMDPQTRNVRAIKCYEKCGFKKVKVLPKREFHEGVHQDCWLMEIECC
ncbi:aminoglycoside 6'-N-acetyltransferase [Virgibacillus subterraneus]|uniref:Aminoglycoside 6'-N-acetyltransferase n=1 Tax=Virgibacillus subterraneus TaxID=621109 RepID=A0A1H9JRM0_9BACI|nr:GNAT family N-acetyltransferase [Virgibacillus subterraneus]SEQ89484.1 aminoglycoside 6'-N-acetyltransferase [Virgibacillus subterraneus]